jgi:hypothetical protein
MENYIIIQREWRFLNRKRQLSRIAVLQRDPLKIPASIHTVSNQSICVSGIIQLPQSDHRRHFRPTVRVARPNLPVLIELSRLFPHNE